MHTKFIALIVACVVIVGFLVLQGTQDTSSSIKLPSELAAHDPSIPLTRLRIAGRVAPAPIDYTTTAGMKLTFKVRDPGTPKEIPIEGLPAISVVYEGIKPDMFAEGRDVILDGEYREGIFYAVKLLTQCPSKYEPPKYTPHDTTATTASTTAH